MTVLDLARAIRRYRTLVVFSVLMTMGAAAWVGRPDTVYLSDAMILLVAPTRDAPGAAPKNALTEDNGGLVATAGALRARVAGVELPYKVNDPKVSIVDEDLVPSEKLSVPDTGGQWSHGWSTPTIEVQVSGRTESVVAARAAALRADIDQTLATWQDTLGVPTNDRITTQLVNAGSTLRPVHNSPRLALMLALLTGVGATFSTVCWMETRRQRREASALSLGVENSLAQVGSRSVP